MANNARGEVEVRLGNRTWKMVPSFHAFAEIEDKTGMGTADLLHRFGDGRFGVREVAVVLWAGICAGHDDAPDFEEIGRMVVEQGVAGLVAVAGRFLAAAITGTLANAPTPAKRRK